MRVGNENMRDLATLERRHQGREMRVVIGAGIDHRDGAVADDIAVGAVKGRKRSGLLTVSRCTPGASFWLNT